MASPAVRLDFLVMERTLRATGCDLPLYVIPYTDEPFDLPENAQWLVDEKLFAHLALHQSARPCRKFLALTQSNAAFFDADIIHLRDPRKELDCMPTDDFVVADTEWNKARWTFSGATRRVYQRKSSLWLLDNFNTGFFAFEKPVLTRDQIFDFIADPEWGRCTRKECVIAGEQPGLNWLVHLSGRTVVNLCLPPRRMESTMAVDYTEFPGVTLAVESSQDSSALLLGADGPMFLHFAGGVHHTKSQISEIFVKALSPDPGARAALDKGGEGEPLASLGPNSQSDRWRCGFAFPDPMASD
ncbi:MAG: hypothetical protein ABL994_14370 [Verrucomicrobiales bacterium]